MSEARDDRLLALRRRIEPPLMRILIFLESVTVRVIVALLSVLPLRSRARLREALAPVARLDYPKAEILLRIDSPLDIGRARGCAKEPETIEWIEEMVRPGDVLYDIGANVGAYSLVAAKHGEGRVTVHAFEPSFSTYAQLCRNIVLNDCQESIVPWMIALSDRTGRQVFHYQSLAAGSSLHILGRTVDFRGKSFAPLYSQQTIGFSIDRLISEFGFPVPNHIKLDVDGTEIEILRGAQQTLSHPALRSIIVEVFAKNDTPEIVSRFLGNAGFAFLRGNNHLGGPVWNYVFVRASAGGAPVQTRS